MQTPSQFSLLFRNKLVIATTISAIILGSVFLLSAEYFPFTNVPNFTGTIIKTANLGIRNVLLSRFSTNPVANDAITIVAIDNKTLSDKTGLGRFQDFKRSYYARVIDHLKRDGAIVIGVDVLFSEKSADDRTLSESMRHAGNVILGFSLTEQLFPIDILREHTLSLGYFHPRLDPSNSVAYSVVPLMEDASHTTWEAFSFTVVRKYLDIAQGKDTHPSQQTVTDFQ